MRDFDRREQRHQHRFGDHRMAKPLLIGAALIIVLGLLVMSLWNALLPAILGVKSIIRENRTAGLQLSGAGRRDRRKRAGAAVA